MVTALTAAELVVAGVAIAGAGATAYAANESASATKNATNSAISAQQAALNKQEGIAAPYVNAGNSALPDLQKLLGLNPDGSQMTPAQAAANGATQEHTLANMPGYQFAKSQGLTSTENAATASGLSLSGNTLQSLDTYSTGLADSTYQQQVGNLQSLVNTGQAAAAGVAANVGSTGNNIANETIAQGNTNAGILANETAGISKIGANAANQYQTNQTLQDIYNGNATQNIPGAATQVPGLVSGAGGTIDQGGYITNLPGG